MIKCVEDKTKWAKRGQKFVKFFVVVIVVGVGVAVARFIIMIVTQSNEQNERITQFSQQYMQSAEWEN